MDRKYITRNIILDSGDAEIKRAEIRDYFNNTYELYEKLFDLLIDDEAFYKQPEFLRHPLVFYFGHTATFFINKFNVSKIYTKRVNEYFESIFAIGVDEMSWDDLNPNNYKWPKISEVWGLDFSARFIKVGVELQESGKVLYEIPKEGEITEKKRVCAKLYRC